MRTLTAFRLRQRPGQRRSNAFSMNSLLNRAYTFDKYCRELLLNENEKTFGRCTHLSCSKVPRNRIARHSVFLFSPRFLQASQLRGLKQKHDYWRGCPTSLLLKHFCGPFLASFAAVSQCSWHTNVNGFSELRCLTSNQLPPERQVPWQVRQKGHKWCKQKRKWRSWRFGNDINQRENLEKKFWRKRENDILKEAFKEGMVGYRLEWCLVRKKMLIGKIIAKW